MVQSTDLIVPMPARQASRARADARERLLAAGLELFSARGIDNVSTRELARAAKVNLSAITYHFDGKDGLYNAVVERVLDDIAPYRRHLIGVLEQGVAEAGGDKDALSAVLCGYIRQIVLILTHDNAPREHMAMLVRETTDPTAAFQIVMARHIDPLQNALSTLVAAATDRDPRDAATLLKAMSILSLCLQCAIQRPVIMARLDWSEMTAAHVETLIAAIAESACLMLRLPVPDRDAG